MFVHECDLTVLNAVGSRAAEFSQRSPDLGRSDKLRATPATLRFFCPTSQMRGLWANAPPLRFLVDRTTKTAKPDNATTASEPQRPVPNSVIETSTMPCAPTARPCPRDHSSLHRKPPAYRPPRFQPGIHSR